MEMNVNKGYWRRTRNSTTIVECLFKDAWLGGFYSDTDYPVKWARGYEGKLWSKWAIIEGDKYQRVNEFECLKCPNPIMNVIRVFEIMLLIFLLIFILIIANVRKTTKSQFSVLLRIITNYLQIMTTVISLSTKYPSSLSEIFIPIRKVGGASEFFLYFDWFITDYEIKGPFESNAIFKLFLMLFLPLILFFLVTLVWLVISCIKPNYVSDLKRNLMISFISILFLLHPKLIEAGINALRWVKIDENIYVALIDTDLSWYSQTHIKWSIFIVLPLICVWFLGIPIMGLVLLFKIMKSPQESKWNSISWFYTKDSERRCSIGNMWILSEKY